MLLPLTWPLERGQGVTGVWGGEGVIMSLQDALSLLPDSSRPLCGGS